MSLSIMASRSTQVVAGARPHIFKGGLILCCEDGPHLLTIHLSGDTCPFTLQLIWQRVQSLLGTHPELGPEAQACPWSGQPHRRPTLGSAVGSAVRQVRRVQGQVWAGGREMTAGRSSCGLTFTVRSLPLSLTGLGAPVQAMGRHCWNLVEKVIAMSWFGAEP